MTSFFFVLFIIAAATVSAVHHPRQVDNSCCFGLNSVGFVSETVKEDHFGDLVLGGSFQQGGFCFDKSTKTIKDTLNHNCFMRPPAQQFECYVGIVGATAFEILSTGAGAKSYLTYDNGQGTFYACPVGSGVNQYYNIFSAEKSDATGCIPVALALYDSSAACFVTNTTVAGLTSGLRQSTSAQWSTQVRLRQSTATMATASSISGYSQIPEAGLWSSMPPSASNKPASKTSSTITTPSTRPSPICSVSPSAPSIAPFKLGYPDDSALNGISNSSAEAFITSRNSTVFLYNIPNSFLPPVSQAKASLCALQFRMPVCTELPKGYPCYKFSGMEQEFLANSGMNFDLILDDGQAAWNGTALHQVFPGESTILGTFECGKPKGSYGARKMSWRVSSVRNFSLEFLHAGVGQDAKFQDGIGAWIVPCQ
ncbi:hypothetical protein F5Y19DRAFT_252975 [Xylariaceae sp. FL1651]|nr:hypothetical protein F5Y19DRAFT_252975 [Xylariaceae sp. FL1651]